MCYATRHASFTIIAFHCSYTFNPLREQRARLAPWLKNGGDNESGLVGVLSNNAKDETEMTTHASDEQKRQPFDQHSRSTVQLEQEKPFVVITTILL
jgi:hypothetical protein